MVHYQRFATGCVFCNTRCLRGSMLFVVWTIDVIEFSNLTSDFTGWLVLSWSEITFSNFKALIDRCKVFWRELILNFRHRHCGASYAYVNFAFFIFLNLHYHMTSLMVDMCTNSFHSTSKANKKDSPTEVVSAAFKWVCNSFGLPVLVQSAKEILGPLWLIFIHWVCFLYHFNLRQIIFYLRLHLKWQHKYHWLELLFIFTK